ncbi:MAG: hypothetical protein U0984_05160 [Prosthecobacter sp.]|nr:hypothetical protein [Prosthecobacter sp.]
MKTRPTPYSHPHHSVRVAPNGALAGVGRWRASGMVLLFLLLPVAMLGLGGCKEKTGSASATRTKSGSKAGGLEGKPVQEWVAQLDLPASEPVGEALRVLVKAPPGDLQPVRTKLESIFEKYRDESQLVAGRAAVLLIGRVGAPLEESHRNTLFRLLVLEEDEAVRRLMEQVLKKAVADGDEVVYERAMTMALDQRQTSSAAASAGVILSGNRVKATEWINKIEANAMAEAQARGQSEPDPFQRAARLKALEALK